MRYETFLLGTAAVLAVATGARAADLAMAESVEYAKVCDAYGEGFFYIPGSDTCLAVSGTMDAWLQYDSRKIHEGEVSNHAGDDNLNYLFETEADVTFQAKSMTDWGMLTSVINFRGDSANGVVATIWAERAYVTLGGFTAGLLESQYDSANGEVPFGIIGGGNFDGDDTDVLQFTWTAKTGPVGFTFSIEDPNYNPIPATPFEEFTAIPGYAPATSTGNYPNIIASLFGTAGAISWSGNFGVMDTTAGTGFGTKWVADYKGPRGIHAGIMGGVSNGPGSYFGNDIAPNAFGSGTYWMVEASAGLELSSEAEFWILGGYQAAPGHSAYEVQAELDWTVAEEAILGIAAGYTSHGAAGGNGLGSNDNFGDAAIQVRFRRNFAGGALD
jgi:hypothetical protein